jgi:hypothetical protein
VYFAIVLVVIAVAILLEIFKISTGAIVILRDLAVGGRDFFIENISDRIDPDIGGIMILVFIAVIFLLMGAFSFAVRNDDLDPPGE